MFELFAALGLRVDGSPLRVYTILSLGEDLGQEATTQLLTNFLVRRVEYKAISTEYIKTYRQQTKELPVWATQVFQIWKALENRTAPLSARQQAFRKLKKTHVEVYKAVEILVTKGGKTEYSVSA